ncbi:hypothetical protein SprV_0100515200 [Sparganum proliferum]
MISYRTDLTGEEQTAANVYAANGIDVSKTEREARKSEALWIHNVNPQILSTCSRCQRTCRAQIGFIGHLQTRGITPKTSTAVSPAAPAPAPWRLLRRPLSASILSIPVPRRRRSQPFPSSLPQPPGDGDDHHSSIPASDQTCTITALTASDMNSVPACRQWDRAFVRRIGLVGHLRLHSTATDGPPSEAPAN